MSLDLFFRLDTFDDTFEIERTIIGAMGITQIVHRNRVRHPELNFKTPSAYARFGGATCRKLTKLKS